MAPPASRIKDVCDDLLAAVIMYHGGVLPDRQFVSAGAPAWDCELVAVWCERTGPYDGEVNVEQPSSFSPSAAHSLRYGTFVVSIARCTPAVPDSKAGKIILPTVGDEESAATELYEDAQRIANGLLEAEQAGALPGCHGIAGVDWRVVGPSGGFVAGEFRVRVGLATGL